MPSDVTRKNVILMGCHECLMVKNVHCYQVKIKIKSTIVLRAFDISNVLVQRRKAAVTGIHC